jgi:hypothetical protein
MTATRLHLLLCALTLVAAPALAGPLDPLASDTNTYLGTWHGSTFFKDTGSGVLSGYIDWAVYAPNTFPGGFSGYTPTAGEYVYAYQADVEGLAALTSFFLTLEEDHPADNVGWFTGDAGFGDVDGVSPDFMDIVADDSVQWYWFDGIPGGERSVGLAFSSPAGPVIGDGTTINSGEQAIVFPLPAPDAVLIPEPGSMSLACCGLLLSGLYWLRRRGRKG